MTVASYSTTPGANTSINGIPIGPGMPRVYVDDAIQNLMADIKTWTNSYVVTYPIAVDKGGTGQTSANAAFNALAAAGGTVSGTLKQASYGAYPHYASTSMVTPKIYVQAMGSDPTSQPGDIVFEY